MDNKPFTVRSFGNDCFGNITGYVVDRLVYVSTNLTDTGRMQVRQEAGVFVGNIYEDGSFEKAKRDAEACAEFANRFAVRRVAYQMSSVGRVGVRRAEVRKSRKGDRVKAMIPSLVWYTFQGEDDSTHGRRRFRDHRDPSMKDIVVKGCTKSFRKAG